MTFYVTWKEQTYKVCLEQEGYEFWYQLWYQNSPLYGKFGAFKSQDEASCAALKLILRRSAMVVRIGRTNGPSTDIEVTTAFDPDQINLIKDVLAIVNMVSNNKEQWYIATDEKEIIPTFGK
jgi:hypothetical protein